MVGLLYDVFAKQYANTESEQTMKSDYLYPAGMVYNTFPWPNGSQRQVEEKKRSHKPY